MPFFPNPRKLASTKLNEFTVCGNNLKQSVEILKFVDFHFKFVDFACRDSTVKCSNLQVRQTNMDHCCILSACYNFDNY
jgi:hypothetical protein